MTNFGLQKQKQQQQQQRLWSCYHQGLLTSAMDDDYVNACSRLEERLPLGELLGILSTYPVLRTKALSIIDCAPSDPVLLRSLVGDERSLIRTRASKLVKGAPLITLARCAPLAQKLDSDVAAVFFSEVLERLRDYDVNKIEDITAHARAALSETAAGSELPSPWIRIAEKLGVMNPKSEKVSGGARMCVLGALRIARNVIDNVPHSGHSSSVQWSNSLEYSLNMLMAMFSVRPKYILESVPVQIVANAIIIEFQSGHPQVMTKQKTIFLFLVSEQLSGAIQLGNLPNLTWDSENLFAVERFHANLQNYLEPIVLPTSQIMVPNYVSVFSHIFKIAANSQHRRLIRMLNVTLEDVPSMILRKVLLSLFMSNDSSIPFLHNLSMLVEKLASEFPTVRDTFLRLISLYDCFMLYVFKTAAGDNSETQSIIDLLCYICEIGIDISKRAKLDIREAATKTIERVLVWISVRFRVHAEKTRWNALWKSLRSILGRCKLSSNQGVYVCDCMAVQIIESSHRKFRVGHCSCRRVRYHKALVPSLEQWSFWECLAGNYLTSDSHVSDVDVWIAWCHAAALKSRPEWLSLFRGYMRCCLSNCVSESGSIYWCLSRTVYDVANLLARKSWSRPLCTVFVELMEEMLNACRMWNKEVDEVEMLNRHRITSSQCLEQILTTLPRRLRFSESISQEEVSNANRVAPVYFSEMEEIERCSIELPCLTEYAGHVGVLGKQKVGIDSPLLRLLDGLAKAKMPHKISTVPTKMKGDKLKSRIMRVFEQYNTTQHNTTIY